MGKESEVRSDDAYTMSNKNIALNELSLLPAILGACTGIFVVIIRGSNEVDPEKTVEPTHSVAIDPENKKDHTINGAVETRVKHLSHEQATQERSETTAGTPVKTPGVATNPTHSPHKCKKIEDKAAPTLC